MTFQQAIQSAFTNYVKFEGQASRSEYWYFVLFVVLMAFAAGLLEGIMGGARGGLGGLVAIAHLIFSLATILPSLGLAFRRLHDTDRSAWWLLINLTIIGGIVTLVFNCLPGTPGPNKYGEDPLRA